MQKFMGLDLCFIINRQNLYCISVRLMEDLSYLVAMDVFHKNEALHLESVDSV